MKNNCIVKRMKNKLIQSSTKFWRKNRKKKNKRESKVNLFEPKLNLFCVCERRRTFFFGRDANKLLWSSIRVKRNTMFKKLFGSISNALTLAFMGYEIGSHVNKENEEESNVHSSITETVKNNIYEENHNELVIIVSIIIVILLLAAIAVKILFAKNRLVWVLASEKKKGERRKVKPSHVGTKTTQTATQQKVSRI